MLQSKNLGCKGTKTDNKKIGDSVHNLGKKIGDSVFQLNLWGMEYFGKVNLWEMEFSYLAASVYGAVLVGTRCKKTT